MLPLASDDSEWRGLTETDNVEYVNLSSHENTPFSTFGPQSSASTRTGATASTQDLNEAREDLIAAVAALPFEDKAALEEATAKVPDLFKKESNFDLFLTVEDFNPKVAVERLARHWKMRKSVFGDDAFLPMDKSQEGTLSIEDQEMKEHSVFAQLPNDSEGRPVVSIDPKILDEQAALGDNVKNRRLLFYELNKIAMENPKAQTEGMVVVRHGVDPAQFDSMDFKRSIRAMLDCMALKIHMFHFCLFRSTSVTAIASPCSPGTTANAAMEGETSRNISREEKDRKEMRGKAKTFLELSRENKRLKTMLHKVALRQMNLTPPGPLAHHQIETQKIKAWLRLLARKVEPTIRFEKATKGKRLLELREDNKKLKAALYEVGHRLVNLSAPEAKNSSHRQTALQKVESWPKGALFLKALLCVLPRKVKPDVWSEKAALNSTLRLARQLRGHHAEAQGSLTAISGPRGCSSFSGRSEQSDIQPYE